MSRTVARNLDFFAERWWARSNSVWSHGRFKPSEKKQQGAQQHVLLVDVCLRTCVSVEVVLSLEYVLISDGMYHNEQEQGNGTSWKPCSILLKSSQRNHGTDLITKRTALRVCPPVSPTLPTPTPSSHSQSLSATLVCLTCPGCGTATPTTPAQAQSRSAPLVCFACPRCGTTSSSTFSAWCGPAPVPAHGHQSIPDGRAVDESSDAIMISLIAVVDREIEVSSAAMVARASSASSGVSASYSHSKKLVDQVDELRVLVCQEAHRGQQ